MNAKQLRELIIQPVLKELGMYSQEAEDLVAGTIAQESTMGEFISQYPAGPALGICQMETATHDDIWDNYLRYRPELAKLLENMNLTGAADEMVWNLRYAVAMCRVHYYRVPMSIPQNIDGQAAYWKAYYNTTHGKGSEQDYLHNYGLTLRQ